MISMKSQAAAVVLAATMAAPVQAADVVIGVPSWPTVRMMANVLKVVLEENLGLDVELQNGTNPIIFEAMHTGAMHVHPEVWLPQQGNLHEKYVEQEGTVRATGSKFPGGNYMCTTRGTVERTGIKRLADLSDPAMAANFDTDGDGRGEVWIGGTGWSLTPIERIRAKSYGYSETMHLKEMDEGAALAEVDAAVAQGKNVVFFCYAPHHVFAIYDLVTLEEPPHDPAQWNVIQPTDDPMWLEKSSAPVAWSTPHAHIHYAAVLEETAPLAASVLRKVSVEPATVAAWSRALSVDGRDPEDVAREWISENREVVDAWLQ